VQVEEVRFYSDGFQLVGVLKTPTSSGPPWPVLVHGPGWMETVGHPLSVAFHEGLVAGGYAVFQFDYRGWGNSEGEPGWATPSTQQRDVLNAITYVSTREDLDLERLGLFAFGGPAAGNAIYTAARDRRVKAVCGQAVIAEGRTWLREIRRESEWIDLLARVEENRRLRVLKNEEIFVDPLTDISVSRPERLLRTDLPRPTHAFHLASVEDILDFRPIDVVDRLSPCALLLCAVEDDPITAEHHARSLYERAQPPRRLIVQRGVSHHASYTKNLAFLVAQFLDWYDRYLVAGVRDLSPARMVSDIIDYTTPRS
jgi:pimeloyl-ACP methyl ester carboxylesterase